MIDVSPGSDDDNGKPRRCGRERCEELDSNRPSERFEDLERRGRCCLLIRGTKVLSNVGRRGHSDEQSEGESRHKSRQRREEPSHEATETTPDQC